MKIQSDEVTEPQSEEHHGFEEQQQEECLLVNGISK